MKLKLLRLKAKSLGLDSTGTREEVESRILESEEQYNFQKRQHPQFNLSDSDASMSEDVPNLLPNIESIRLNDNPETKSRVSAFDRLKRETETKFQTSAFSRIKRHGETSSGTKRKYRMPQSEFFTEILKDILGSRFAQIMITFDVAPTSH